MIRRQRRLFPMRIRMVLSSVLLIAALAAGIIPCAAQLSWHQEKGFRWAELKVPAEGRPGFTLLPPEQTGITFINPMDERAIATNRVLGNGCGVALGDFDNDGLTDIFLCSLDGHNALYKNLGGMKFRDVTAAAGDQLRQPDLPGGGFCGHQRGRLAGFAGQHRWIGRAVLYQQGGRDICRVQPICRHAQSLRGDHHGPGGH